MKNSRLISIALTLCMLLGMFPAAALAIQPEPDEKSHIETYYYGDVNIDGLLNTGDASFILKYCANPQAYVIEPGTLQCTLADANLDGVINTGDATFILRVCAGMEEAHIYEYTVLDTYTVSYAPGIQTTDSLILPASESVEEQSEYAIKDTATLAGHEFYGWHADFNNTIYNVGDSFVMPAQDVILTAVWDVGSTEEPTGEPTDEPTDEPAPTPAFANITLNIFDCFNEVTVGTYQQSIPSDTTVLNGSAITLPDGYKLDNPNFSAAVTITNGVASPQEFTVNVYPYQIIDNAEFKVIYNLIGFLKVQNNLSINYIMGADIDLSSVINFKPFGWDWNNFDAEDTYFTGIFDGNGHKVTGLHIRYTMEWISDTEYSAYKNMGLFSVNSGTIRNLDVYTRVFTGDTNYGIYGDINVGVIAGYNMSNIENCHTYGNIGSFFYADETLGAVGGICGTNGEQGVVKQCSFEGGVEGFFYVGGIAGKCFGTIEECYFAGGINWDVEAEFAYQYSIRYIGGICGGAQNATIKNSYAVLTYNVRGEAGIGGLVGWIKGGTLQNCYVYGAENILFVTDNTGGVFIGYTVEVPTSFGIYNFAEQSGLPAEYSVSIWDMSGQSYSNLPDLINNRRNGTFYDAIA